MKIFVLGATGGTGRLIVRDAVAKGHSVVALVRSMTSAGLPDAGIIEGDARNEATIARARVASSRASPSIMLAPGRLALAFERTSATTESPFATASRTISRPVPPVAPKTRIFMFNLDLSEC